MARRPKDPVLDRTLRDYIRYMDDFQARRGRHDTVPEGMPAVKADAPPRRGKTSRPPRFSPPPGSGGPRSKPSQPPRRKRSTGGLPAVRSDRPRTGGDDERARRATERVKRQK